MLKSLASLESRTYAIRLAQLIRTADTEQQAQLIDSMEASDYLEILQVAHSLSDLGPLELHELLESQQDSEPETLVESPRPTESLKLVQTRTNGKYAVGADYTETSDASEVIITLLPTCLGHKLRFGASLGTHCLTDDQLGGNSLRFTRSCKASLNKVHCFDRVVAAENPEWAKLTESKQKHSTGLTILTILSLQSGIKR